MSSDAIHGFAGPSVPPVPGALGPLMVTTSAAPGHVTIPGIPGNSVLLVSNLNPEVSLIDGTDANATLYQLPESCRLTLAEGIRDIFYADNMKNRTAVYLF